MTTNETKTRRTYNALRAAIAHLDATEEERETLDEILHVEGFGGAEDYVLTAADVHQLAEERLAWLRDQRAEALR